MLEFDLRGILRLAEDNPFPESLDLRALDAKGMILKPVWFYNLVADFIGSDVEISKAPRAGVLMADGQLQGATWSLKRGGIGDRLCAKRTTTCGQKEQP
jgi:hypothetical protein